MPTAQNRPSLAKKPTRAGRETAQQKEERFLNTGVELFIDGERYEIRLGDMTALDAREMRRQVGVNLVTAIALGFRDDAAGDIDMIAAVLWLARYVNRGEKDLTYEEVLAGTDYTIFQKLNEGSAEERKRIAAEEKAAKKAPAKKAAAEPEDDSPEG